MTMVITQYQNNATFQVSDLPELSIGATMTPTTMRRGNAVAVASVYEKDGKYQGSVVLTVPFADSFCEHYRSVDTISETELDAMERAQTLAQLILKGL